MPRQDVAVELFYDGAWHDLVPADDVFADPIRIMRGNSDESPAPRPASVELQLANDDDMYRTTNPESPLYGKAGVNTPLRVSVGGTVRAHVEASSYKAGQTRDFRAKPKRGKAWVDVEGGGMLQRVNQWTEPLKSPFRQYNELLTNVVGYWPMEQARGSTELICLTPGANSNFFNDVAPDSQHRPPSSAPLVDMGSTTANKIGGSFARNTGGTGTSGWQFSWTARYEQLQNSSQTIASWTATNGVDWALNINPASNQILLFGNRDTVPIVAAATTYGTYDWSQFTLFSIDAQYSAGTTTVWVNWANASGTQSGFFNGSYAGDSEELLTWEMSVFRFVIFNGVPAGSTIGHVLGVHVSSGGGVDLFNNARREAFTGYLGETAADRFERLCTLKGIAYTILGTAADSHPMGPQAVDTLAKQFEEIQTTEDGLIFDDIDAIGLVLMLRNYRYNQTPALTLNTITGSMHGMPAPPVEVADDLPVHNVVTAAQRDGREYTATDSTSPMGTQAPPDGRGEYRQRKDVNVADEATGLYQQAHWWLGRGTVDLPRFPQVVVNMAALDAAKLAEVEAVDVGSVIEIVNYRENTIRLYVLGYLEVIGKSDASRAITFTCAPDRQFQVGEWDSTGSLWDSRTTTLKTTVDPSATSVTFRTTSSKGVWSTTDTPYPVFIAGQLNTVTAMGAASLVSGAYDQAATLRRGVNGVRKSLAAGEPIHPATPGRWAL